MNDDKARSAEGNCALLNCEVCCKEIPPLGALNAETADYIYHFCGPRCFARFNAARVADLGVV